jgi:hypothetical protein
LSQRVSHKSPVRTLPSPLHQSPAGTLFTLCFASRPFETTKYVNLTLKPLTLTDHSMRRFTCAHPTDSLPQNHFGDCAKVYMVCVKWDANGTLRCMTSVAVAIASQLR